MGLEAWARCIAPAKLGRDVALKILPNLFASDPDRQARFQREAQVLASLNHPHIAGIYVNGVFIFNLVETAGNIWLLR